MFKKQPRIVVVTRGTRLEGMLRRWGTLGQARFSFERAKAVAAAKAGNMQLAARLQQDEDLDFLEFEREDATYQAAVRTLIRELDFGVPVQEVDRQYLPSIDFDFCSAVIVVGPDGLVANVAKYVGDVPIVAVNPDPDRIDGVLLPYSMTEVRSATEKVILGKARFSEVTLAKAMLHDGQSLLAFNDFFIGARTHVSARYDLTVGGQTETQSSSGVLVSTGAGATGWMSSVFNMAHGVAASLGASVESASRPRIAWDSPSLLWAVREPFVSRTSAANLVAGRIQREQEIVVESRMDTNGVIFSDGIEADFLPFDAGAIARIRVADQKALLVTPS